MSDFDKFFAEKLNEEVSYPRMGKNWKSLSGRLNAFDAGMTGGKSHLRFWQAAAVGLVAITAVLVWRIQSIQRENTQLQKHITVLEEKSAVPALGADSPLKSSPLRNPGNPTVPETASGQQVFTENEPDKNGFRTTPLIQVNRSGTRSSAQQTAPDNDRDYSENLDAGYVAAGFFTATAPFNLLPTLDLEPILPSLIWPPPRAAAMSAAAVSTPPSPIRPVRERHFRAGVLAVAGTPVDKPRGISWFRGAGVSAEYTPVRNWWLTASAQWLRYDVKSTDSLSKRFFPDKHPEPDPKPGKPKDKLVQVEGNPRQQHLELGIRYIVPLPFRLRPSIRVAHAWTRIQPGIFSFQYEEKKPGGPGGPGHPHTFYFARTPKPRWTDNNWRFGAGLEYETPGLVFSLGADYSKTFDADALTFDGVMARASVQYTF